MEVLKQILRGLVSPVRYKHCLGVMEEAEKLAVCYNADADKARTAGLLHDCVKELPPAKLAELEQRYALKLDTVMKNEQKLLHAPIGAEYIKNEIKIYDDEIYDAVYYHTTAKADMCLLTKIIYTADFIEPNRSFEQVEALRILAYNDIDRAVYAVLDMTINKLVNRGSMLHLDTINARNQLLSNFRKQNQI